VPGPQRGLFALMLATGSEFAFVVFGVARDAAVLPDDWDARLTLAAALSMALTPLLLRLHDRLAQRPAAQRPADAIDAQDAPVILAGFGRYGQIVGRVLLAAGVRCTVLDSDPDNVESIRRFGFKVFYGDARRLDLLEAAGAARAKLLVVAIDDVAASLALVDLAREQFPHLTVVARARNVRHALELAERGVTLVQRETFESALVSARQALELLAHDRYEARQIADTFRRQNLATLAALQPHFRDDTKLMSIVKSGREELEENLRRDREARDGDQPERWS
jgi:glutathione-regulated potassium-efflux system ancillary protein KefC